MCLCLHSNVISSLFRGTPQSRHACMHSIMPRYQRGLWIERSFHIHCVGDGWMKDDHQYVLEVDEDHRPN
jgi:hypothetical protein